MGEYACRLREPSEFAADSFRRTEVEAEGKTLGIILGKPKGSDTQEPQALRYTDAEWSEAEARAHCEESAGSFDAASGGQTEEAASEAVVRGLQALNGATGPRSERTAKRERLDQHARATGLRTDEHDAEEAVRVYEAYTGARASLGFPPSLAEGDAVEIVGLGADHLGDLWALWKHDDGDGAWYVQMRHGEASFVAHVDPRSKAYHAAAPFVPVLTAPIVVKHLGWSEPAWEEALFGLLGHPEVAEGIPMQTGAVIVHGRTREHAVKWASDHGFMADRVVPVEPGEGWLFPQRPSYTAAERPRLPLGDGVLIELIRRPVRPAQITADPLITGRTYKVIKADGPPEKRYALGIVYTADGDPDAHGDHISADELEAAAWSAMARGVGVGVQHEDGTEGVGVIVESYLWPTDEAKIGDEVVHKGDWLAAAIFDEGTFGKIKAGEFTGWSLQGWARKRPSGG